ncbi:MAG: SpoIVB peptidase [Clostridiales bacterium]|nr:SpoIVB peptidase [Clostridiales bacterium]
MAKNRKILKIFLAAIFVVISLCFPYQTYTTLENDMYVTTEEFAEMLSGNFFISPSVVTTSTDPQDNQQFVLDYKLFDLFNIKRLRVNVIEPDRYFAGGNSLGFTLQSKGLILIGGNYILSNNGIAKPFEDSDLQTGDIITHINDIEVNTVTDINNILNDYDGSELLLTVKRQGEVLTIGIQPALDKLSNTYKLGLWVKEDAVGVGTLTFINATTGRFGSLGHSINDSETNECLEVSGGNIYRSKILGVKRGVSGRAGELMGTFSRENVIGSVDKNCEYGVYGYVDDVGILTDGKTSIDIGGRLSARPGNATILSCIDGETIEEFDIEIIKTNFQSSSNQKSMVIRVTDKDLIERTGGIVQGMSGSPIIQNGKLIGAVTHVFVNDATKGFGLYIDWMIEQ